MEEYTGKTKKAKDIKYDDYIKRHSKEADAAGRREPYHLTYIREYEQTLKKDGD